MVVLTARVLIHPFTRDQVAGLRAGDMVRVTGRVFTGRDRFHKHLAEGGRSPVDLKDGALYHCGPVVLRREGAWVVRAAGPTTSTREEPYLPKIIREHGVRLIIGKGSLGAKTAAACAEFGCVYLHAVGGAAQVLAECIQAVPAVHLLREFGPTEAVWEFDVKDFPAVVAIDARGESLLARVQAASRRALRRALRTDEPFLS